MKHIARAAALAALCSTLAATAQDSTIPVPQRSAPPPPATRDDVWVTLGAGLYEGKDFASGGSTNRAGYEVGGAAGHVSLNVDTGSVLLRGRYGVYTDYTSNVAEEVALQVGLPLLPSRKLWLTTGGSWLDDVNNRGESRSWGVPVELVFYPLRGMEVMVHGNLNPDSRFFGVALGGAIGRQRPR